MKLKYLYILLIILLCGCTKIEDVKIEDIVKKLETSIDKANTYHTGYKYYIPSTMNLKEYMLYNDVIETSSHTYYMYVDVISYFEKKENTYEVCESCFYSQILSFDKKTGYIEINLTQNEQYLIEIMYNYAKIEVIVDYEAINLAITNAVSILRSIEYTDKVIESIILDNSINYQEEIYNIFDTSGNSNYLETNPEKENTEEKEEIKDSDLIN